MNTTKEYVIGMDRLKGSIIRYTSEEEAIKQGTPYKIIVGESWKEVKQTFIDEYTTNNIEME